LAIDRVIHEPARLLILTVLSKVAAAEFRFLETTTGLTKGNLSSHLSKLEIAGYVVPTKSFRGKIPVTTISITKLGAKKLKEYQGKIRSLMS
jgi:DNA-binding transcriptional ArsR family regulator